MTLKEAEQFYKKYQCSSFCMAREDLPAYNEYRMLNIDKQTEEKWTKEEIDRLSKAIRKTGSGRMFNRLYDLAVSFRDASNLKMMAEAINDLVIRDVKTSLCIAETIMGRKKLSRRSGMIFWAYDLGDVKTAALLIEKAASLICIECDSVESEKRAARDRDELKEIGDALGLPVYIE